MKTIFQAAFSAFLLTFVASQDLFIFEVLHMNSGINNWSRCAAIFFNSTANAIAPASCFEHPPHHILLIRMYVYRVTALVSTEIITDSHPYFDPSNPNIYNVGVVHLRFNSSIFQHFRGRELSEFPATASRCHLHGFHWRNGFNDRLNIYQEEVNVLPAENCGNEADFIHCSIFESTDAAACEFMQGSPLICDGRTVSGFVLNKNGCEMRNISDSSGGMKQVVMLQYNSLKVFHQWERIELTTPQPVTTTPRLTTLQPETTTPNAGSLMKFSTASMILSLIVVLIVK